MAKDIGAVLARLDAADGTGALLAAAWDGFQYLLIMAGEAAGPGSASFPALQLAATAAAAGRDTVGQAPSMPVTPGPPEPGPASLAATTLSDLAELAAALYGRLSQACALPGPAADQAAFGQAAAEAQAIRDLLGD